MNGVNEWKGYLILANLPLSFLVQIVAHHQINKSLLLLLTMQLSIEKAKWETALSLYNLEH